MEFTEYEQYDGLGLAELIRNRSVEAGEVLEAAVARAEAVNPQLNAIVHFFVDEARKQLEQSLKANPDAPFAGVPFLLKDLLPEYAGQPMTKGSRGVKIVPEQDDTLVSRIKQAGLVSFAKTNCPELGLALTTESKAHGPAHNPWRQGYSTGGSSGGSAAAVAAGVVPLAQADDGGGSIRYPAACNGVFGLKPSRGRTPIGPNFFEWWEGAVVPHCVSRTVRDSAALLDAISGPEPGAVYRPPANSKPFLEAVNDEPGPLNIAVCDKLLMGEGVEPEVQQALEKTVTRLQELGHRVEPVSELPAHHEQYWLWFMTVVATYVAADARLLAERCGRKAVDLLEPATKSLVAIGEQIPAADLAIAKHGWRVTGYKMELFHQQWDVLLQPTMPNTALPHGKLPASALEEIAMKAASRLPVGKLLLHSGLLKTMAMPMMRQMGFTSLANLTGQPAMSVPLHMSQENLPIGMMFSAAYGNEYLLYQLAGQLERACPWQDRRPAL